MRIRRDTKEMRDPGDGSELSDTRCERSEKDFDGVKKEMQQEWRGAKTSGMRDEASEPV